MWSPDRVVEVLQMRPFLPFWIHTADGQEIEVPHPEVAAVFPGERVVVVTERESIHMLDILTITNIEFREQRSMEELLERMKAAKRAHDR